MTSLWKDIVDASSIDFSSLLALNPIDDYNDELIIRDDSTNTIKKVSLSVFLADLDLQYLRLDCSNDPITNVLNGEHFNFTQWGYIEGGLGVGHAVTVNTKVYFYDETLISSGGRFALQSEIHLEPWQALTGITTAHGGIFQAIWDSSFTGNVLGYIYGLEGTAYSRGFPLLSSIGVWGRARHQGQNDLTDGIGVKGDVFNDDAIGENGNITNGISFLATAMTDKTTGSIINRFGLYVQDITGGGESAFQTGLYIEPLAGATVNYPIIVKDFNVAGIVKNDANGIFTGGNTITVSEITDIATNYLKLDCSNDPLTNELDVPGIFNSVGSLKIMPDAQGNVDLFGDTDVADDADGKAFTVNRRAAEGDTYFRMMINDDRWAWLDSNWDISIRSNVASGVIELGAVATNIVRLIGTVNCIGEPSGILNLPLRHYGYITAGALSAQKYVSWKVDDADDWFHLTRQDASILGFQIDVPVEITEDTFWSGGGSGLAYGCIGGINQSIVCTNLNQWYQITFTDSIAANLVEIDVANEEIEVDKAGVYLVSVTACFQSAISSDFEIIVQKNDGATELEPHMFQTTAVGGKVENTSGSCFVTLAANDRLELWVRCTSAGGRTAVFEHVTLDCLMVGG